MDAMASADPTTGHDRDKALVASSRVTTPPGDQGTVASYPPQTSKGSRTMSSLAPGSAAGAAGATAASGIGHGSGAATPVTAVNNGPVMSKGLSGATAPPLSSDSVIQTRPVNPQSVAPPDQHVSNATGPTVTLARPPMQTAGSGATLNGSPAGIAGSARQTGVAAQTPYVNNGQSVCAGSHASAIIQAAPQTTVAPCDAHVPTTAAVGPGGVRTLHPQMLPARLPQPPVGQPGVHNIQIPHGKVLVRNERGQLLLIPQQALAQIQAQSQAQGGMAPRTAAPTNMTPGQCLGNAIINRPVSSMVRQGCPAPTSLAATTTLHRPAVLQSSVGASLPGMIPRTITQTAGTTVTSVTVSKETMENVMKCKSFLSTLIKLASSGKQSVETAANVRALVKDLLEDKLEAEEFTSRLYKELHSSPQPYLVPFLKRSLPALRQLTPDSAAFIQQSQHLQLASAPVPSTVAPKLTVPPCRPQLQPGVSKPRQTSSMVIQPQQQRPLLRPQVTLPVTPMVTLRNQAPGHIMVGQQQPALTPALKNKLKEAGGTFKDDEDINDVASMAGVNLTEESANILATNSGLVGVVTHSCKDEAFLSSSTLQRRMLEIGKRYGVTDLGAEVVNFVSHATQQRLQNLLEKVSHVAQQRNVNFKEDDRYEQSSDVRAQLRFFEQLDQQEKQRKEEQEREILLKAAKSRARQEDPEQLRLKQKAKEMQQQELAQMRHREANLAALAAIGPRKKRKILDSSSSSAAAEGSGPGSSLLGGAASLGSRSTRQRITRVNLRDLLFCLENERCTSRSHFLYKGFLK